ncbi:MAG: type IV toxin-antitoxin system AbiEi family antitoxin domain-containing protein [Kiritimatiellia bacterium]
MALSTNKNLYRIAEVQQGYFTTKQAKRAGYAENTHPYHVHVGNWVREHRGIYRLARFPSSPQSDLVMWSLWSRDRTDVPQGIYSHVTALSIYELSDVMPSKLHMSVPYSFRRNSATPPILILHKADIDDRDIEQMTGFKVTRPLRTILDLMAEGKTSRHIIKQALEQALQRGLITRTAIKRLSKNEPLLALLDKEIS